ncbi:MAG: biopolymer transporter ExbD [Chitinispirillaceae bacterium]|nr:biopolymer transporter ExbD [Chitinispirillaceae bacterium]
MVDAFVKLFNEGGWVLYPIFLVSIIVWYIGIGKAVRLRSYGGARRRLLSALGGNAPAASLAGLPPAFRTLGEKLAASRRSSIRQRACAEFMVTVVPQVQNGISTIAACAVIAPLLGLLGTITGMNNMFSVIGIFGFGNPTIMSSGISIALQATLTGLGVAIAAFFVYDFIRRAKTKLLDNLSNDLERLGEGDDEETETGKGDDMHFAPQRLLPEATEKPEINLAPFVDIMTVLLIFFVVTANLYVETGVDVSKPKAMSSKPMGQKSILVGITREGTVHVYGRQVNLERLKLIVEQETAKQPDISVVIIADRAADVGRAVEVMDNCMLAGAQKVSIAASKESSL